MLLLFPLSLRGRPPAVGPATETQKTRYTEEPVRCHLRPPHRFQA